MSQSRQLAAIMFTDIVGYTALMQEDEERAFELLKKNRAIQRPIIEKFNGRWLKEIGDGVLASFTSVTDAVYCAATIQKNCENEPDLQLRIGIHQGEVVFEENDVFGDGVNIAARLEPLALPGGIVVSESVYRNLRNKKNVQFTFVQDEQLKNVREPVKIYSVKVANVEAEARPRLSNPSRRILTKSGNHRTMAFAVFGVLMIILVSVLLYSSLSQNRILTNIPLEVIDKSIAVIPFVDMSPGGDHEWLSDGISEELLNALVRLPDLKVVGRTSSWRYKGVNNKDLKAIGQELGVETILEGSVRKVGTRIRITAQLVNTKDGFSLWSQTYDRELVDIFAIQDQIATAIVKAMEIYLIDKFDTEKSTSYVNIDAYTKYLKARQILASRNIENLIEAKRLFKESIRLDANYDPAYSGLARAISLFPIYSSKYSAKDVIKPAKEAAKKALELNPQNSEAYSVIGYVATYYEWDWASAEIAFKRSIETGNNDAEIYNFVGDYYQVVMHPILAIEMETIALELDPLNATSHFDLSRAYALFGDWKNALRYAKSAQSLQSLTGLKGTIGLIMLTSYIELGQVGEAEKLIVRIDDRNDDYYIDDYFTKLELNTLLAIAKSEKEIALSQIEQMIKESKWPRYAMYGRLFLSAGEPQKAAYWFEKAVEIHDWGLISHPITNGLTIPENPVLQQTLDVPELNTLFEIRKMNLVMAE